MALNLFIKKPASAALNSRIAPPSMSTERQKDGTLTNYCEGVSHVLETNATDDSITKMDAEIIFYTQPSNMAPTEFA